jgi:hypothetical protein
MLSNRLKVDQSYDKNGSLLPHRLPRLLRLKVALPQEAVHLFPLEPAVASCPQAISVEQLFVSPLPHCVGMDMEEISYLGSSQHS